MKSFKKIIIIGLGLLLMFGLIGCSGTKAEVNGDPAVIVSEEPERMAEVFGKVKSVEGNLVVIAEMTRQNGGAELSEEDRAKRRTQMMSLSEEERQKLRDSWQKATGNTLKVIVPVGIPVFKKQAGPDGSTEESNLGNIKPGVMVNVWIEEGSTPQNQTAEYVGILPQ